MEKKQYVTPQTLMVCIEANEGILRISGGGTYIPIEGGTLTPRQRWHLRRLTA